MRRIRVERYINIDDGPMWECGKSWIKSTWRGGAFFMFDGIKFEVDDNDGILCKGIVVGRVADDGDTYFIGPNSAPTRREFHRSLFLKNIQEATI